MTTISFKFDCFNSRRAMRGAEAASLVVHDPADPEGDCMLWMSKSDVGRNIMAFGRDPALVQAWEAYEAFETGAAPDHLPSGSAGLRGQPPELTTGAA